MDARKDHRVPANPDVVSDRHLYPVFIGSISHCRMNGMTSRIDRHIRGHLAVVADRHRCYIYDSTIVICEKVLSNMNMLSIITVKWRVDKCAL